MAVGQGPRNDSSPHRETGGRFMQGERVYRVNRPRVIFENIDGELILVNMEKGCYFSTDEVGANIWELVESGHTVAEILEALRFRYDGDPDRKSTRLNSSHE